MNTDRSIAPLVAQFVPLKIDTSSPEWQTWARKHPPDGRGIPIIYVIRADGMKLYGKSGALDGPALPQLMAASLQQSGTILTDQQVVKLEEAVAKATQAEADGDIATAITSLATLSKIGTLGDFKSHAKAALEADQLVAKLTEQGKAALKATAESLGENAQDDKFAAALAYVEAKRMYAKLPDMKTELASAARSIERNDALDNVLKQASSLDAARLAAQNARTKRSGIERLKALVARYPGTPVSTAATAELKALDPDYAPPSTDPTALRTWSDATGKYSVKASFQGITDGEVVLKSADGRVVKVPLEKLSEPDRAFAQKHANRIDSP